MPALATNRTTSFDVIRYLTISKFSLESGYTEYAIRAKIRDGVWLEGRVWVKAPDGRILISIEGYNLWAEEVWRPRHQRQLDRNHLCLSRRPLSREDPAQAHPR